MPRKAYLQDLEEVCKGSPHPYVKGIRRGEDDGSFLFTFAPNDGTEVELNGIIPELSNYPTAHQIYLCTTSSDVPSRLTSAIDSISKDGVPIPQLIQNVANSLSRACMITEVLDISHDGSANSETATEDEDEDFSDSGWFEDEDELKDVDGDSQMTGSNRYPSLRRPDLIPVLRQDLRDASAAGFRVGVLGDYEGGADLYVSISVRIFNLGISDEAMSAWDLEKNNYLILLIHFSDYYRSFNSFLKDSYHGSRTIEFSVVTSKRHKPTLKQAIKAFTVIHKWDSEIGPSGDGDGREESEIGGVFISRPLVDLLKERLVQLLLYRAKFGMTWDGAEKYWLDNQGLERGVNDAIGEEYYKHEEVKGNLPNIVTADALSAGADMSSNSFPLLTMQFTLRHLVRCTEFCLVCHKKVSTDFEAIKPYVCSNPLCLWHHMALGFGPSIEYEIKSQPTVVDLLISFCYVSAKEGKLKDFPTGMSLQIPSEKQYGATYFAEDNKLLFPDPVQDGETEGITQCPVKVGDWIVLSLGSDLVLAHQYHCRVVETEYYPRVLVSAPLCLNSPLPTHPHTSQTLAKTGVEGTDTTFSIYDASFDLLQDKEKREQIIMLLDTLPSVMSMRSFLQKSAFLFQWKDKLSPAALGVLRWIIASNRSCIVPVDGADVMNADGASKPKKTSAEQRVYGMENWVQFRFAMGAPDKEQRFVSAVQDATRRLNLSYPSIFAFHGSPLNNWHSIIREGLNFDETAHGRAFGHGCYHSLDLSTSLGYSRSYSGAGGNQFGWRQSMLQINQAICLNEIVNSPSEFVSRSPHLVVSQLDWIQTRYLFVNTAGGDFFKSDPPAIHFPQDPKMMPRSHKGTPLIIPCTASSYKTRASLLYPKDLDPEGMSSSRKHKEKPFGSTDPVEFSSEDEDDREFLWPQATSTAKGKMKMLTPEAPKTDFARGQLDTRDIELLAPPSYASTTATKRLQAELRSMLRLQATQPLHELGWYIDPNLVENVYQWIVEFHSFDPALPLAKDMKNMGIKSIVLEARFGASFPMSPPFIRVIKPRFVGFNQGGGGHVTAGGAMCMELLTNSGWSAVSSLDSVLLQVRMAITQTEPRVARLQPGPVTCYQVGEAKEAYVRACRFHGWDVDVVKWVPWLQIPGCQVHAKSNLVLKSGNDDPIRVRMTIHLIVPLGDP